MPTYQYAFDEDGQVVDASDLVRVNGVVEGIYRCIGCNEVLVPKVKGLQRVKHFAHQSARDACGVESYLHHLAKKTFFDVYTRCLETGEPFWVELTDIKRCDKFAHFLGKSCDLGRRKKAYDLLDGFTAIAMEQRDGEFVPDVLLYHPRYPERKLYIEIYVNHMLSQKKANSSNRIIEINIDAEEDIQCILDRRITEKDASFIKFPRAFRTTDSKCLCLNAQRWVLFIFESGKVYCDRLTLMEIDSKLGSPSLAYYKIMDERYVQPDDTWWQISQKLKMQAITDGVDLRDCNLCIHRISNAFATDGSPAYCKAKEQGVQTYEAIGCQQYQPKDIQSFEQGS